MTSALRLWNVRQVVKFSEKFLVVVQEKILKAFNTLNFYLVLYLFLLSLTLIYSLLNAHVRNRKMKTKTK